MIENRIDDIPQLSEEENVLLTSNFTEEEVFQAITQMEHNKSPGPDGFPAEFYQRFWDVIKKDLMAMFGHFQAGGLPLFKLNFGIITLLPKKRMQYKFSSIDIYVCLMSVLFFFTKVATNRVSVVAHTVVKHTHMTFMLGRHILEGVVVLHEMIHELHRKKMDGVLFKIDFEKAYDKVKWPFLQQVLRMKGFDPIWCDRVKQFVQG
jgi:hypothetical protein